MYNILLDKIFCVNCPNFINNPATAINKVKQSVVLDNGTEHHYSIREFHDMFQLVLATFSQDQSWSFNPFLRFVEGVDNAIKDKMESSGFQDHLLKVDSTPP